MIVILIEFIVSIIGLIALWFVTTSASDAVVICLVVLAVIGVVKLLKR